MPRAAMKMLFPKGPNEPNDTDPLITSGSRESIIRDAPATGTTDAATIHVEHNEPPPVHVSGVTNEQNSSVVSKKKFLLTTTALSTLVVCLIGVSGYLGAHYAPTTTTTMMSTTTTAATTTTETTSATTTTSTTKSTTTTPSALNTSILVLYTINGMTPTIQHPFITSVDGTKKPVNFNYDDKTSVYRSCSVSVNNTMIVYGGANAKRQISQVTDCSLKIIGTLPFDFDTGSCAYEKNMILLCADTKKNQTPQTCYISSEVTHFTDTSFTKTRNFRHYATRMASADGKVLAVGDTKHARAEYFDTDTMEWIITKSYPYSDVIYWAPMVAYHEQIYILGGQGKHQNKVGDIDDIGTGRKHFLCIIWYFSNQKKLDSVSKPVNGSTPES